MFLESYTIVNPQIQFTKPLCRHAELRRTAHVQNRRGGTGARAPRRTVARAPRTCSQTCSQTLLHSTLINSGKSSVVVWKNLPTGGPLDTQTYPRVNLSKCVTNTILMCEYEYEYIRVDFLWRIRIRIYSDPIF